MHLVYLRKNKKVMNKICRIDVWITDDTMGCEQGGHEGSSSAFPQDITYNDTKHWDPGEIKHGRGNTTCNVRKYLAALERYSDNREIAHMDVGLTHI